MTVPQFINFAFGVSLLALDPSHLYTYDKSLQLPLPGTETVSDNR